jgi:uncharacterized protein DUF2794
MIPGDIEPSQLHGGEASGHPPLAPASRVTFDRRELNRILNLYGRMVAAGEWRDYGMDSLRESAVFSVFRRSAEAPLYRIEKHPALARKQGAWAIVGQGGHVLKRGHDLEQVLRFFDKGRFSVVE